MQQKEISKVHVLPVLRKNSDTQTVPDNFPDAFAEFKAYPPKQYPGQTGIEKKRANSIFPQRRLT